MDHRDGIVADTSPPSPLAAAMASQTDLYVGIEGVFRLFPAAAEDTAVARRYAQSVVRGPLIDGTQMPIMAAKKTYCVDEEIHVIHLAWVSGEIFRPERRTRVMAHERA